MAREIGSEFWNVPVIEKSNGLFPESTQWFISGRSALQAIIKELGKPRNVSLPAWCCDSVIKPFVDAIDQETPIEDNISGNMLIMNSVSCDLAKFKHGDKVKEILNRRQTPTNSPTTNSAVSHPTANALTTHFAMSVQFHILSKMHCQPASQRQC